MANITLEGILSYPHLFTPRAVQPGDAPKYSANLLIAKDNPLLPQLEALIEQAKAAGFPTGFPAGGKLPLKQSADYPDYWQINCNSLDSVPVVDMDRQPVVDRAMVFAGAKVFMNVGVGSYNQPVNKGVSCFLNGVMTTGVEGPLGRIDGRQSADQMFGAAGAAPATTAAVAPAPPPTPATPPAAAVGLIMTPAANGMSYEQYREAGWSDEQMIAGGVGMSASFG